MHSFSRNLISVALLTLFSPLAVAAAEDASNSAIAADVASDSGTAADAAADGASDTLAEVVVESRAQKLYRVNQTSVGKMPEDPLNIPQSVQVVNAQMIEDQGARDIRDLYRDVPGISANNYATVTFRGFAQDVSYYDGLRGDPFQTFSVPQLFTIERVEFLKGPSGMLYGPGSPGGAVNYVTRKPSDTFSAQLRGIIGNYSRNGASADVTGPLDSSGIVDGRLGVFYEDYDSYRAHASSRTKVGDGGLKFHLGDTTQLTLQLTDYNQDLPGNRLRGIPVDANGNFLTYRSWNHNEPTDFIRYNGLVTQARLDSAPSEALSFNVAGRWFRYHEFQEYHEPIALKDSDGDGVLDTMTREFRWQKRNVEGLSFGSNLIGHLATGGIRHTVLAGADWDQEDSDSDLKSTRDVPSLSLFDPVYGTTSVADYDLDALTPSLSDTRAIRYGAYLQDQVALGEHFIVVGGLRHDWFKDNDHVDNLESDSDATTSRAGVIYKPQQDISLYVSWADTFEPQDVSDQTSDVGGPFDPITGDQIEGGVKARLLDGRVQGSFATYRIVRKNIVQEDPDLPSVNGVDQLSPIGEVTSKGAELALTADLTRNWVISANYAYNDARITGTVEGQAIDHSVGDRFPNAPHQQAGLWSRYQFAATGTAVALGAQYVSSQLDRSGDRLKPFTVYDATVTQDLGFAEAMLRVVNLFDKYYATSGFTAVKGAYVGDARSVFLELRRQF